MVLGFFLIDPHLKLVRLATTTMTRRRPAIAITADLSIWVGNTSDVDFSCEPGELIGFGTGGFEEKIIGDLFYVCFSVSFGFVWCLDL